VTNGGREGKEVNFDAPEGASFAMPSGETVPASAFVEWEVPREAPADWPQGARKPLADFWEARIARQKEIDASIAAKAEFEYLYDKPYPDNSKGFALRPLYGRELEPPTASSASTRMTSPSTRSPWPTRAPTCACSRASSG